MLRNTLALSLCAATLATAGSPALADITTTPSPTGLVSPVLAPPALAGSHYAFIGRDSEQPRDGVYLGLLGDTDTPPRAVIWRNQAAPNRPERKLEQFLAPAIVDGSVLIGAGPAGQPPEGLYLAGLDGVKTIVNGALASAPAIGDAVSDGAAWVSAGIMRADITEWKNILGPGDRTPDGAIVTGPARSAIGGGRIVLLTPVMRGGQNEQAIYALDAGPANLRPTVTIATPPSPIDHKFVRFGALDTDGRSLVFVADQSPDGRKVIPGVYTRLLSEPATAPARPVALAGEPSPLGGSYKSFGVVAIDAGVIYFNAVIGVGPAERTALLMSQDDNVQVVMADGDRVASRTVASWSFGPSGADRGRLLLSARFDDGGSSLVLVDSTRCIADYDRDGRRNLDDLFGFIGGYLSNKPEADVNADGQVSEKDLFDFLAAYLGDCRA